MSADIISSLRERIIIIENSCNILRSFFSDITLNTEENFSILDGLYGYFEATTFGENVYKPTISVNLLPSGKITINHWDEHRELETFSFSYGNDDNPDKLALTIIGCLAVELRDSAISDQISQYIREKLEGSPKPHSPVPSI